MKILNPTDAQVNLNLASGITVMLRPKTYVDGISDSVAKLAEVHEKTLGIKVVADNASNDNLKKMEPVGGSIGTREEAARTASTESSETTSEETTIASGESQETAIADDSAQNTQEQPAQRKTASRRRSAKVKK